MIILAIETSCDETAVAIVENGRKVLTNVIASQIKLHEATGGVVPEVAAREHLKAILPVLHKALAESGLTWGQIDAIAVTKEPGLPGALLVGRATAAALAFAHGKKLIEVNHLHGHFYSGWLEAETVPQFPILILSVSGGHNDLILHESHGEFQLLGETLDDAAGEAFDKSARLLGLGYPGGPMIEKKAKEGNPHAVAFPRSLPEGYNFSFSGLKTAVLYHVQDNKTKLQDERFVADVAASFQEAVTDILVKKLMKAVLEHEPKELHVVGGVSANRFLRGRIEEALSTVKKAPLFRIPAKMSYCTDNAAMIGAAAYFLT